MFFLQGRFIFGPDARSLFVTMFLIVAPVSIFCAFVARGLMDDFSYGMGLSVMIAAVLFTAYVSTILVSSPKHTTFIDFVVVSFYFLIYAVTGILAKS